MMKKYSNSTQNPHIRVGSWISFTSTAESIPYMHEESETDGDGVLLNNYILSNPNTGGCGNNYVGTE